MEPASGCRRSVVRRVLQVADRLHIQVACPRANLRVRRNGRLRHPRQSFADGPPDHRHLQEIRRHQLRPGGSARSKIIQPRDLPQPNGASTKAFPATEQLWNAISTCWNWQEPRRTRISDELDFAAISGWESTAIENHSGIVDNLRNFKSDPSPISQTLQPIHPVAKQRSTVVALGESATFDLYLLNDTSKPATGTLTFTMITPSGKRIDLKTLPAPTQAPDVFSLRELSYLTEEGLTFQFEYLSPLSNSTRRFGSAESARRSTATMHLPSRCLA